MLRMTALAQSMATASDAERERLSAELGALRSRGRTATAVVTWLLVLAASGMAVARYA
jgi:hypothetical protein